MLATPDYLSILPEHILAHITGESLVPTGGVSATMNQAEHWIRGEYEE